VATALQLERNGHVRVNVTKRTERA